MKKVFFILSLLPLLVLNIAPMSVGASDALPGTMHEMPKSEKFKKNNKTDKNNWSNHAEAINDAEAEEKILSFQSFNSPLNAYHYGFSRKDQFAVPNERNYLPDEPPIA